MSTVQPRRVRNRAGAHSPRPEASASNSREKKTRERASSLARNSCRLAVFFLLLSLLLLIYIFRPNRNGRHNGGGASPVTGGGGFQDVEFDIADGWPIGYPKYDLNGFHWDAFDYPDEGGFVKINSYCKQSAACKIPEPSTHLAKSEMSCDSFTEVFKTIRSCQQNESDRRVDSKCDRILLDRGFWRNVYQITYQEKDYVLKVIKLRHQGSSKNLLRHIREARLLQLLDGDPNIVPGTGHCLDARTNEFVLISPFYANGNLEDFVEEGKLLDKSLGEVFEWCIQIAEAIKSMHALYYVHTDLQLRQVLLADDGSVKLNDFNRGKWITQNPATGETCEYCGARSRGRWRAPEEYQRNPLDQSLDIYTLGMMIWALWANESDPMKEHTKKQLYKLVPKGERPEFADGSPEALNALIAEMWATDKTTRPKAPEVVKRLYEIRDALDPEWLKKTKLRDTLHPADA